MAWWKHQKQKAGERERESDHRGELQSTRTRRKSRSKLSAAGLTMTAVVDGGFMQRLQADGAGEVLDVELR